MFFWHRNCAVTQKRLDITAIITIARQKTLACGLSKAVVFNDLEQMWPKVTAFSKSNILLPTGPMSWDQEFDFE